MFIKLFKKNQSKLFGFVCLVIIILLIICLMKSNRIDTFYFQAPTSSTVNLTKDNYNDNDKFPFKDGIRDYSSVTHIPDNAFQNTPEPHPNIEGEFPNLIYIGKGAFSEFTGKILLTNLNKLESIGENAFLGAGTDDSEVSTTATNNALAISNVNALLANNALATIDINAFKDFRGTITLLNLNNLKTIGENAFAYAGTTDSLVETYTNTNTTIDTDAFDNFKGKHTNTFVELTKKNYDKFPLLNDGTDNRNYSSVTHIPDNAFENFTEQITLKNLNNLVSISNHAFNNASNTDNAVEITGINKLQSIGVYAFYNFKGKITLLNLNNLVYIGKKAFNKTSNTSTVVSISGINNLQSIGDQAFYTFKGKITLQNLNKLKFIGWFAFAQATHTSSEVSITGKNVLIYIGLESFYEFKGKITLLNLNTLKYIEDSAFYDAGNDSSVVSINYDNNLEEIDSHAFYKFKGKITLQNLNKLKFIGWFAFMNASNTDNAVEITGINKLQSIGNDAFNEFKGKITLTNLNNLTYLGESKTALAKASNTSSLICGSTLFEGLPNSNGRIKVHCPFDAHCGDGTTKTNGVCVPNYKRISCGDGTTKNNIGECVPDYGKICGEGTTPLQGKCITKFDANCGDGTTKNEYSNCVTNFEANCGDGTKNVEGNCVPDYNSNNNTICKNIQDNCYCHEKDTGYDESGMIFKGISNCNEDETKCDNAKRFSTGKSGKGGKSGAEIFEEIGKDYTINKCKEKCIATDGCKGVYYRKDKTNKWRCSGLDALGTIEGVSTDMDDYSWAMEGEWPEECCGVNSVSEDGKCK